MPRLLASMIRFSIWSETPRPWRPPMALASVNSASRVSKVCAVERDRLALLEADGDGLGRHVHVGAPRGHAHDRVDDGHAPVEELEVLRLVRGAQDVRVGGVRLVGAHLVLEAGAVEVGGHLRAAAQLVDELLVQPRLVDLQPRVDEQAVAVEPLDVVALVGAAVAPDVDVVLLHRRRPASSR